MNIENFTSQKLKVVIFFMPNDIFADFLNAFFCFP